MAKNKKIGMYKNGGDVDTEDDDGYAAITRAKGPQRDEHVPFNFNPDYGNTIRNIQSVANPERFDEALKRFPRSSNIEDRRQAPDLDLSKSKGDVWRSKARDAYNYLVQPAASDMALKLGAGALGRYQAGGSVVPPGPASVVPASAAPHARGGSVGIDPNARMRGEAGRRALATVHAIVHHAHHMFGLTGPGKRFPSRSPFVARAGAPDFQQGGDVPENFVDPVSGSPDIVPPPDAAAVEAARRRQAEEAAAAQAATNEAVGPSGPVGESTPLLPPVVSRGIETLGRELGRPRTLTGTAPPVGDVPEEYAPQPQTARDVATGEQAQAASPLPPPPATTGQAPASVVPGERETGAPAGTPFQGGQEPSMLDYIMGRGANRDVLKESEDYLKELYPDRAERAAHAIAETTNKHGAAAGVGGFQALRTEELNNRHHAAAAARAGDLAGAAQGATLADGAVPNSMKRTYAVSQDGKHIVVTTQDTLNGPDGPVTTHTLTPAQFHGFLTSPLSDFDHQTLHRDQLTKNMDDLSKFVTAGTPPPGWDPADWHGTPNRATAFERMPVGPGTNRRWLEVAPGRHEITEMTPEQLKDYDTARVRGAIVRGQDFGPQRDYSGMTPEAARQTGEMDRLRVQAQQRALFPQSERASQADHATAVINAYSAAMKRKDAGGEGPDEDLTARFKDIIRRPILGAPAAPAAPSAGTPARAPTAPALTPAALPAQAAALTKATGLEARVSKDGKSLEIKNPATGAWMRLAPD